jgi:predicted tellurium resistance membrane protein TerC
LHQGGEVEIRGDVEGQLCGVWNPASTNQFWKNISVIVLLDVTYSYDYVAASFEWMHEW